MQKLKKTNADIDRLRESKAKLLDSAEKSGMQQDYFFLSSWDRLEKQIHLAEAYWSDLESRGAFIPKLTTKGEIIEISGQTVTQPNPSGDRFEKACRQIDSSMTALSKIMQDLRAAQDDGEL